MSISAAVNELSTLHSHATRNKWPSDTVDMVLNKKNFHCIKKCVNNDFLNPFWISDLTEILIMMDELYEAILCFFCCFFPRLPQSAGLLPEMFYGRRSIHQHGGE